MINKAEYEEFLKTASPETRAKLKVFDMKRDAGALSPLEQAMMQEAAVMRVYGEVYSKLPWEKQAKFAYSAKMIIGANAMARLTMELTKIIEEVKDAEEFRFAIIAALLAVNEAGAKKSKKATEEITTILKESGL